jgi:methylmalonyl-CoA mutase N-terminal domain/subunit
MGLNGGARGGGDAARGHMGDGNGGPGGGQARWEAHVHGGRLRDADFTTLSGMEIPMLATPETLGPEWRYDERLGWPGDFPYTRGVYPTQYRGRLWTMRQFSGFGTAQDTNERYKYLLAHGQTGLSVAFDMPTLMGYDSDDPLSEGEVGRCGVAVASLADMETLFDGIPVGAISTSMTINSPAAILWAMYLVNAEKRGADLGKLEGTLQNDILKEFIAQKEYIYPPLASLKLVVDTIEFGARHVPKWHPVSVSGYHIREAGSTAAQELAFTLADGFAYVEACLARGLAVDDFAPRLSFFWNAHSDFFEEIGKYRAARRIYAHTMREKYGAKKPASWQMRFHTQTAGCSLTAQQPENNIVRTALQALAAVLGGTQSLHTNSMDETLALPTEKAVKIALRTQQIIAHETGVANSVDPLGGSYFVEHLTDRLEREAKEYFRRIDGLGGVVAGIEQGFFQKEIGQASFHYQRALESKRKVMVGVNELVEPESETPDIETLKIGQATEDAQNGALRRLRAERNGADVRRTLDALRRAAGGGENVMPLLLDATRAYATLGEMVGAMRDVYGTYVEAAVI